MLNNLEPVNSHKFPHNFLSFIESHQTQLFDGFLAILQDSLTQDSIDHLRIFVEGDRAWRGGLGFRIMEALHGLSKERDSLRRKVRLSKDRIRRKTGETVKDQNYEEELNELQQEMEALQALVNRINERDTFNFYAYCLSSEKVTV